MNQSHIQKRWRRPGIEYADIELLNKAGFWLKMRGAISPAKELTYLFT